MYALFFLTQNLQVNFYCLLFHVYLMAQSSIVCSNECLPTSRPQHCLWDFLLRGSLELPFLSLTVTFFAGQEKESVLSPRGVVLLPALVLAGSLPSNFSESGFKLQLIICLQFHRLASSFHHFFICL